MPEVVHCISLVGLDASTRRLLLTQAQGKGFSRGAAERFGRQRQQHKYTAAADAARHLRRSKNIFPVFGAHLPFSALLCLGTTAPRWAATHTICCAVSWDREGPCDTVYMQLIGVLLFACRFVADCQGSVQQLRTVFVLA